jgi:hypothetical protein
MSHWHGLAKLRMHSDLTLSILDQLTTDLGTQFRLFNDRVCPSYLTQELYREVGAQSRRQTKEAAKRAENVTGRACKGASTKGKEKRLWNNHMMYLNKSKHEGISCSTSELTSFMCLGTTSPPFIILGLQIHTAPNQ